MGTNETTKDQNQIKAGYGRDIIRIIHFYFLYKVTGSILGKLSEFNVKQINIKFFDSIITVIKRNWLVTW